MSQEEEKLNVNIHGLVATLFQGQVMGLMQFEMGALFK